MIETIIKGESEIREWLKRSKTIKSIAKLPGDASTRQYYRIVTDPQTQGLKTYILMKTDSFLKEGGNYPFIITQSLFKLSGVDVPEIYDFDSKQGYILLEDLGDTTLLRKLQNVSSPDVERHLYEKSIDALIELQINGSPQKTGLNIEPYRLRFDHEKLMWEVEFTLEQFYKLHLKRKIHEKDLTLMKKTFSEICEILELQPTYITHRDYHSRNIMVLPHKKKKRISRAKYYQNDDRLVMIDFQDARMGPAQYDLASLLRDSYYQLGEPQIERLLDYYISKWEGRTEDKLNRKEFKKIFDLMSVQRNFKAIGSFASFYNRRGDATYLKYIGNTFENIRRTLLKYSKYSELREVLFHYYYF